MAENGKLDISTLVQATNGAPGQLLERQTEVQWAWMCRDAAASGVILAPEPDNGIPSCYRDFAAQQKAFDELGYPKAAYPGESNHGWGTAVDIALTSSTSYWLQANATRYGFIFNVAGEPWHAYRNVTLNPPVITSNGVNDMLLIIKGQAGKWSGGLFIIIGNHATLLTSNSKEYPAGVPQLVSEEQIQNLRKVVSGI